MSYFECISGMKMVNLLMISIYPHPFPVLLGGSLDFSITYAKCTPNLPPLPNPPSTQRLFTLCVHV